MENPITAAAAAGAAKTAQTQSELISTVSAAVEEVTTQIDKFKNSAVENASRIETTAAATSAQTAIKVQAAADAGAASQVISRELLLAEQKAQRNTLAVFQAAGGQAELLEEATKQFAASEAIDDLEAGIDEQMSQDYGLGFINDIINEFRVMDDKEDIKVQEDKQVRAENNIGSLARITREASQTNQLAKLTATDATILATEKAKVAATKIAIADAELSAIRLNSEGWANAVSANGTVLDAHMSAFKSKVEVVSLASQLETAELNRTLLVQRIADAPLQNEIVQLQLKERKREDVIGEATLAGVIEGQEVELKAKKLAYEAAVESKEPRAQILKQQLALLSSQVAENKATVKARILRTNAENEMVVYQLEREIYSETEKTAIYNIGLANAGQPEQSAEMIQLGSTNPQTAELYSKYFMSGISNQGRVGNHAADTAKMLTTITDTQGTLLNTPVNKAYTMIRSQFTAASNKLISEGKGPDSEEAAMVLYNDTAAAVMQMANDNPIDDSALGHPYLIPPIETLALSSAVTSTAVWSTTLSKMNVQGVDRIESKMIYDSALNLVRMGKISAEQGAQEISKIFQASIDMNANLGGTWEKWNLPPQTKYMIKMEKPKSTYKSLLSGAGEIATAAGGQYMDLLAFNHVGYTLDGIMSAAAGQPLMEDTRFLETVSDVTSNNYIIDAADYTAVFQILSRDRANLGPLADNTGEK